MSCSYLKIVPFYTKMKSRYCICVFSKPLTNSFVVQCLTTSHEAFDEVLNLCVDTLKLQSLIGIESCFFFSVKHQVVVLNCVLKAFECIYLRMDGTNLLDIFIYLKLLLFY